METPSTVARIAEGEDLGRSTHDRRVAQAPRYSDSVPRTSVPIGKTVTPMFDGEVGMRGRG